MSARVCYLKYQYHSVFFGRAAWRAKQLLKLALLAFQHEVWNEWCKKVRSERKGDRTWLSSYMRLWISPAGYSNVQFTQSFCWLTGDRQGDGWLIFWCLGGALSVYQARHRRGMGKENANMKNRQREIETVMKWQQVSRKSITRLCWRAVSGGSR